MATVRVILRCWLRELWKIRRIFIVLFIFLVIGRFYITSNPPRLQILQILRKSSDKQPVQQPGATDLTPRDYAYATLLCDDVMIDAAKVLIYSLKKTTDLPFLLLVLPGVQQRAELVKLGAEIHEISMLDYPFRVTAEKAAINKMCRYSKLHIWRFIEYKKIIFIDVDCLVMQSLDNAFKWSEFSAVRDAGDTFNTGLFVLEPSLKTWDLMKQSYFTAPSYNQGDQGFINWYFRNSTKTALPVKYNTVCKNKGHAVWPLMRRQAKMIHYTSETKPWNFFASPHKYWRMNFDALMYYHWSRTYRTITQKLRIGNKPTKLNSFILDVHDPKKPMWLNSKRVSEICDRYYPTIENNDLQDSKRTNDKFSVIFTKWRNIRTLTNAIHHYRFVLETVLQKIYISWNPSLGKPGIELTRFKFLKEGPPVEIIYHRFESNNNIWSPVVGLTSKAVFLADDEHLPDLEKMEIAFEAWKNNPQSLVGFFARYHTRQKLEDTATPDDQVQVVEGGEREQISSMASTTDVVPPPPVIIYQQASVVDDHHLWIYNITSARRPRPYSLLSSQMLMLSTDYLFIYSCLLPESIHRHIDEQGEDAADLAMNVMIAGMTGSKPFLVKSDFVDPESGRFAGESWALTRGQSLKDLVKTFTGGAKDPFQYNSVTVAQFNKIPFKKRSIKQWNKLYNQ